MTPSALRSILRWSHILAAAVIGTYLYSPWSANPALAAATLWLAFPLMALTGVGMWQQRRLLALFGGGSR